LYLTNAAQALDYLPGVSIQHIAANRNEAGIMVRGFSSRGQVPLYIDGIPISVPYDGYLDFNRYLTSDIGEIQVARGYSSPLLGPNALGGSINMVTEETTMRTRSSALAPETHCCHRFVSARVCGISSIRAPSPGGNSAIFPCPATSWLTSIPACRTS
jgi:outer membrane cobalamin receptor